VRNGVEVELFAVGSTHHLGALVGLESWRLARFPALVALIRHPAAGAILFDTGYGTALIEAHGLAPALYRRLLPVSLPGDERLDRQLVQRGIAPADLALVVLSHVHPDHIGGLADLPPRPLVWSRAASAAFDTGTALSRFHEATLAALRPGTQWRERGLIEDRPVIDLDELAPGFGRGFDILGDGTLVAVPLPGHARGQMGLLCRLADGRTLFLVADAAWIRGNITEGREPARLVDLLCHDAAAYHDTLLRLRRLHTLRPDIIMMPSHCARSLEAWPVV
jgi:glyoxylase-like metal-dependent hydrolase (beta-lactamase superfamily II)